MTALGFDTSNYTTSAAYFDGVTGKNSGLPLDVEQGQLGLRQSDALFMHVKRLPEVAEKLLDGAATPEICAVGASSRPRNVEGSYMPCFLAGASQGAVLARVLGVPFYAFSHQEGHVAAAAWSAGRMELMDSPMLVWHLSGGTTELLYVEPEGAGFRGEIIGGTADLAAGQLIDRAGVLLGLGFPAGRVLDTLAAGAQAREHFKVKINDLSFSLSGVENKIKDMRLKGAAPGETAYYAVMSVVDAVKRVSERARGRYGGLPLLFSGGVASNSLLRAEVPGVYAEPKYSTDNAMGAAILTHRRFMMENGK